MIETSSDLLRKSLAIFGYLRKFSGNVRRHQVEHSKRNSISLTRFHVLFSICIYVCKLMCVCVCVCVCVYGSLCKLMYHERINRYELRNRTSQDQRDSFVMFKLINSQSNVREIENLPCCLPRLVWSTEKGHAFAKIPLRPYFINDVNPANDRNRFHTTNRVYRAS